jgi:hypothetical protein
VEIFFRQTPNCKNISLIFARTNAGTRNDSDCQFEREKKMEEKKIESLTGKWIYEEDYGYGTAKGELLLEQNGKKLSGKIIFCENADSEDTFMIQENIEGEIIKNRIKIKAIDFDVIHSEYEIRYELDSWEGMLINETTIEGESLDEQGIAGNFRFSKLV